MLTSRILVPLSLEFWSALLVGGGAGVGASAVRAGVAVGARTGLALFGLGPLVAEVYQEAHLEDEDF